MKFQTYFRPYKDYFWQWEEEAEVLSIPNGNTIAYRQFAMDSLQDISPLGIPPFGSFLLAIIATNATAKDDLSILEKRLNYQLEKFETEIESSRLMLENAFSFLFKLPRLDETYKTGNKRRVLFYTIFMDAHNRISTKKAEKILNPTVEQQDEFIASINTQRDFNPQIFYRDFRIFELLNEKYPSLDDFINALATMPKIQENDFEELLEASPTDLQPDGLVDTMLLNPKTFHVAALMKRIWSGLNIPFQNLMPSEQPLGGISDLTNKGTFDKLLISEFAYDDLSFLSRLANNEALYLHREAPPDANHLERVILIDNSLKNWGTPKTIAYAVMLAIAHHPKAQTNCQVYALGNECKAVSFQNINQIIESLQELSDSLDCSKGLMAFYENSALPKHAEAIFISSEEAIQALPFQKVLQEYQNHFKFWIYTNIEGQISLYKNQNKSKKFIQTIQLPLADLWTNSPQNQTKETRDFDAENYPILFPRSLNPKMILSTPDEEFFVVTAEKNLMRLYDNQINRNNKGWKLLYEQLPITSGTYEIGLTSIGDYLILIFNAQNKAIHLFNLTTGAEKTLFFHAWKSSSYKRFLFFEDQFHYLCHSGYWTIDFSIDKKAIYTKNLPKALIEAYQERDATLEKLAKKFWYAASTLKNISSIEISTEGNFLFNKIHQLIVNSHGVIKLEHLSNSNSMHKAVMTKTKKEFTFSDGSLIKINRSGMLTFISQNKDIPVFYVPTVLDAALGVGTERFFAGNDYYNPSDHQSLDVITSQFFWKTIVTPFIENIQRHAT